MKGVLDGLQRDDVRQISGYTETVCSVVCELIYVTLSSQYRQVWYQLIYIFYSKLYVMFDLLRLLHAFTSVIVSACCCL